MAYRTSCWEAPGLVAIRGLTRCDPIIRILERLGRLSKRTIADRSPAFGFSGALPLPQDGGRDVFVQAMNGQTYGIQLENYKSYPAAVQVFVDGTSVFRSS